MKTSILLKQKLFKELFYLTTKNSHFIFDATLYKQIDCVAMGLPLAPTLANAFLFYHVKNWLEHCPLEYRPLYYRRYVDDIFVLFNSAEHLKCFHSYLNSHHLNISFMIENEKHNRMSFLDVYVIHEKICSDWTKFHLELVKLIDVFKNNGYPENFINNCFKVFLDNKYRIQEKVITVPKKTLFLVLPYLGPLSLETRTKLRKSLKGILNCCKLQIVLKSRNKLAKSFHFKVCILKELTSGVIYKFHCGLCNESYYDECEGYLNVGTGEHIGIPPLARKKVKPKGSVISDHWLPCNHFPSFKNFSVLTKENKNSY